MSAPAGSGARGPVRFAQVLDDGSLGPMRFTAEKRDRIDAINARLGRPALRWTAVEVTEDGSADVRVLA